MNPISFMQHPAAAHVGRVVLCSLFILGGVNKILNYGPTLVMMQKAGLEPASVLLPFTILLELGGGLTVAFGKRFAAITALVLAAFTLTTNIIFHNFWAMEGEIAALQLSLFFKNIAITGGLLYAAANLTAKNAE